MAGIGAYGRVLADPAARAFTAAALLARLPMSMTGLGTVLLVSIVTGSFGRAGLVVGVSTLAQAAAAPWWGRVIDHIGQARVLVIVTAIYTVGVSGVLTSVLLGWPLAVTLVTALLLGLGYSPAGAAVRARWAHRLRGTPLLDTAYAWESVLDEVVFIVGPLLATFLATTVHPALGLVTSLVLGVSGGLLLAVQRRTEPPVRPRHERMARPEALPVAFLVALVAAFAALGALFGSMEVVIVAFATESGFLPAAGLFVTAWSVGSLVSGVAVGAISWRREALTRFRIAAVVLGFSVVPLPFAAAAGAPLLVGGLLFLGGLSIAPTLIAANAVLQLSVPASRLTEALGWTSTGIAGGLAIGSASVGQVIDGGGAVAGFVAVVVIGVALVLSALCVRRRASQPSVSR